MQRPMPANGMVQRSQVHLSFGARTEGALSYLSVYGERGGRCLVNNMGYQSL